MALLKLPGKSYNMDSVNPFVNNVFDNLFNDSFISDRLVTRIPAVNITESVEGFTIELAAPGLQKTDFKINIDKNILSIAVEKQEEQGKEGKVYTKKEFNYTSFARSFTLPETIDYSNINANYKDGLLEIVIGKKEEAIIAKRLIEVE